MKHNPIKSLNLLHCYFVMAAGMINTLIEVAMCGECTPADIGNSLSILKEYIDKRLDLLDDENRKLHGLSILYEDTISDKELVSIYEEYQKAAGEGETNIKEIMSNTTLKLLPHDKQSILWRSIREAGAASRKQGFLDGFRKVCSVFRNMEVEQNGKTISYAGGCGRGYTGVS